MKQLMGDVARRCPGGVLPDNYLVLDFETNGLEPRNDRILSVGYLAVRGRKAAGAPVSHLVKHAADVTNPPRAFAVNGITRQMMSEQGLPAPELFGMLADLLEAGQDSGCMVLGHNIAAFDIPFLGAELKRVGRAMRFRADGVLDTGMLVLAPRLGLRMQPDENLCDFFLRAYAANRDKWLKWSLDWCYANLNLKEFLQARGAVHEAGDDCLRTHYVFERIRQMCGVEEAVSC